MLNDTSAIKLPLLRKNQVIPKEKDIVHEV